ncbi:aldose 1-epimerase [Blumeria hordei DH14]|uniref:Aldose 1-epimerase n=1 Tax=Blumeria graminis f. sp. hordei (strain DH14) TaxID=546991 RepID=N1JLK8_BLUG1|nr:aldose 1-epimerase [Blumeria hordei DH14]
MPNKPIAKFLPLGAIVQTFMVDDRNIVQGFPSQALYEAYNSSYFGETIGRVANRVSNARINSLNNKSYNLSRTDEEHSLHGGALGWGKKIWDGPISIEKRGIPGITELERGESVMFKLTSDDGDQGYPGAVEAQTIYTTGIQLEDGKEVSVLGIEFEVRMRDEVNDDDSDGVAATVVNMTNHSYFNLSGEATIDGTIVSLCTEKFLPVTHTGIPISLDPLSFPGVVANEPFTLTSVNIDNCFIVDPSASCQIPLDTRSSPLRCLVSAHHQVSGIRLEVLSTEPAFQFYTGKYIDVPAVGDTPARGPRSGFCVEPGRYVDAVNRQEWKNQVVLKKGQTYGSRIVYRAWSDN